MLNLLYAQKSHVLRVPVLLWMATLHPIGLNGVTLKLIGPL